MPSYVTCDVNDFYDALMEMAYENYAENEAAMCSDVYALADSARDELRKATGPWSQSEDKPDRPAHFYEHGWKSYHHKPSQGHVEAVVANASAPGLTHLIEKPHRLFVNGHDTGRMTKARPHIAEAYEHASERFDRMARVT